MTTEPERTRALLVEDDPSIVDLIRSNLAVRGFETIIATDGDKALAVLDAEKPDIVLLDLMLPETDGFVLCRQIRERSHVAVIVVSARGGEHDKVTALNMGADDYMTKPFSVEELLARISATLRRTRLADTGGTDPAPVTVGDLVIDSPHRGDTGGEIGPSDADGVRAAARARDPSGQVAQPRAAAAPSVGELPGPRSNTCECTWAVCGPSSSPMSASRSSSLRRAPAIALSADSYLHRSSHVLTGLLRERP
jgi:CheY-like chemotaxis protein